MTSLLKMTREMRPKCNRLQETQSTHSSSEIGTGQDRLGVLERLHLVGASLLPEIVVLEKEVTRCMQILKSGSNEGQVLVYIGQGSLQARELALHLGLRH